MPPVPYLWLANPFSPHQVSLYIIMYSPPMKVICPGCSMVFFLHNPSCVPFVQEPPGNLGKWCFATSICQFYLVCEEPSSDAVFENQPLSRSVKKSHKKVSIMFGGFVESIYLCIRNREGRPLRLWWRKSSLKIFSIQTSSTRSNVVMSSRHWVIERTVNLNFLLSR